MSNNRPKQKPWYQTAPFHIFVVAMLISFVYLLFILEKFSLINTPLISDYGSLGDTFGIITAAASLIALYYFYETLRVQQIELSETRLELEETRNSQVKASFETTFFKLIEMHKVNFNEPRNVSGTLHQGLQNFKFINSHLSDTLYKYTYQQLQQDGYNQAVSDLSTRRETTTQYFSSLGEQDRLEITGKLKRIAAHQLEEHFTAYFKNIMTTLTFISKASFLPNEEKNFYLDIFRAQMTDQEITVILVFYKISNNEVRETFDQFNFFEVLPDGQKSIADLL